MSAAGSRGGGQAVFDVDVALQLAGADEAIVVEVFGDGDGGRTGAGDAHGGLVLHGAAGVASGVFEAGGGHKGGVVGRGVEGGGHVAVADVGLREGHGLVGVARAGDGERVAHRSARSERDLDGDFVAAGREFGLADEAVVVGQVGRDLDGQAGLQVAAVERGTVAAGGAGVASGGFVHGAEGQQAVGTRGGVADGDAVGQLCAAGDGEGLRGAIGLGDDEGVTNSGTGRGFDVDFDGAQQLGGFDVAVVVGVFGDGDGGRTGGLGVDDGVVADDGAGVAGGVGDFGVDGQRDFDVDLAAGGGEFGLADEFVVVGVGLDDDVEVGEVVEVGGVDDGGVGLDGGAVACGVGEDGGGGHGAAVGRDGPASACAAAGGGADVDHGLREDDGVGDAGHGEGDFVAHGGFAAVEGGAERGGGASFFGGIDEAVVVGVKVDRQAQLLVVVGSGGVEHGGVGGDRRAAAQSIGQGGGGGEGAAFGGQGPAGAGVFASADVGGGECVGLDGGAHGEGDDLTHGDVSAVEGGREAGVGVADFFGGVDEAVVRGFVQVDAQAQGLVVVGRCGRRGVEAVVLQRGGGGAAGAGDGGVDGGVAVGGEVAGGHGDAVAAAGVDGTAEGLAVDGEGDNVALCIRASDRAGGVDAAGGGFGHAEDVVRGDGVDAQGGEFAGVGCGFDLVVLQGGGGVATGAGDFAFDAGVAVGDQVAGVDVDAVAAVGGHGGGVVLAVERQGDDVASGKCAADLAFDFDRGHALLVHRDDVVAGDGLDGERGLEADTGGVELGGVGGGRGGVASGVGEDGSGDHGGVFGRQGPAGAGDVAFADVVGREGDHLGDATRGEGDFVAHADLRLVESGREAGGAGGAQLGAVDGAVVVGVQINGQAHGLAVVVQRGVELGGVGGQRGAVACGVFEDGGGAQRAAFGGQGPAGAGDEAVGDVGVGQGDGLGDAVGHEGDGVASGYLGAVEAGLEAGDGGALLFCGADEAVVVGVEQDLELDFVAVVGGAAVERGAVGGRGRGVAGGVLERGRHGQGLGVGGQRPAGGDQLASGHVVGREGDGARGGAVADGDHVAHGHLVLVEGGGDGGGGFVELFACGDEGVVVFVEVDAQAQRVAAVGRGGVELGGVDGFRRGAGAVGERGFDVERFAFVGQCPAGAGDLTGVDHGLREGHGLDGDAVAEADDLADGHLGFVEGGGQAGGVGTVLFGGADEAVAAGDVVVDVNRQAQGLAAVGHNGRGDVGVDRVVLHGRSGGAAGAGDGAVDGGVGGEQQLGGGHGDAVGAAGHHAAAVGFAVDGEGDHVVHGVGTGDFAGDVGGGLDRKSTRLNSSHITISYAVFCLKKKKKKTHKNQHQTTENQTTHPQHPR